MFYNELNLSFVTVELKLVSKEKPYRVARRKGDRQKPTKSRCQIFKMINNFSAQSKKQSNLQGYQTLKKGKKIF